MEHVEKTGEEESLSSDRYQSMNVTCATLKNCSRSEEDTNALVEQEVEVAEFQDNVLSLGTLEYGMERSIKENMPVSTTSAGSKEVWEKKLPPGPHTFSLSEHEWTPLRQTQKKFKFSTLQWTNIFIGYIKQFNPYCSFAFKWHKVSKVGSKRKGYVFNCEASCSFTNCPMGLKIVMMDEKSLQCTLTFSSGHCIHKAQEARSRYVRADARQALASVLKSRSVGKNYQLAIKEIPDEILQSGNRDDVPSRKVLNNIKYDSRKKSRYHPIESESLRLMALEMDEDPHGVRIRVSINPLGVCLWSPSSLDILKKRLREDVVYFDVTGGVVKKKRYPFCIYEIVVRSPIKGKPPLAVATYVTDEQTHESLGFFLCYLRGDLLDEFSWRNEKYPKMIMFNGSVMILSSILTFLSLELHELQAAYYRIVTGKATEADIRLPIIHCCHCHIAKKAEELCEKTLGQHCEFGMHLFGILSMSSSLPEIEEIVAAITTVFCSSNFCNYVEDRTRYLNNKIHKQDRENLDVSKDLHVASIDETSKHGNFFASQFKTHLEDVVRSARVTCVGSTVNTLFNSEFVDMLKEEFLPVIVLWTRLLLGDLGRHGTGLYYDRLHERFMKESSKITQNYTRDNRVQGVTMISQWKQRLGIGSQYSRLDDFVSSYRELHKDLVREFVTAIN